MAIYELLETRIRETQHKKVWLYDLLEARIKERQHSDQLFRLLEQLLKENGQR